MDKLVDRGVQFVGICKTNRVGSLHILRDVKDFEHQSECGNMRYVRSGRILYQQWRGKRIASMLFTYHKGDDSVLVLRNTKQSSHHVQLLLLQAQTIHDNNSGMGGVDSN